LADDGGVGGREVAEERFGFLRCRHCDGRGGKRLIVAFLATCVKEQHSDGKNHIAKFMSYVLVGCEWVSTRGCFPQRCT
jgi:hypothetical protein